MNPLHSKRQTFSSITLQMLRRVFVQLKNYINFFLFQVDDMFSSLGLSSYSSPTKSVPTVKPVNSSKNVENALMNSKSFSRV